MPSRKRQQSAGPALFAIGYVSVAPWGCVVVAAVTFVVAALAGLAAGRDPGDVVPMAAVAALLIGVAVGGLRYRYRQRLEPTWQRMRRGEFRAGGR